MSLNTLNAEGDVRSAELKSAGPSSWSLDELQDLPDHLRGAYVVVGNFDGVHRGHREVIQRASKMARVDGRRVVAITFDPHPRVVLAPHEPFVQLTGPGEKARLLKEAGVDDVITLKFDSGMASLQPEAFVQQVLTRGFEPERIIASRNFRFGKKRIGGVTQLAELGPCAGTTVEVIPPLVLMESDEIITSTAIRSRLALGDIKAANNLLGRRWTMEGIVVHGDKRGRELGFPTANLDPFHDVRIGFGIYAVRVLIDGKIVNGVASYGTRPQFDDGAPRLEVHILDFSGDIYGAQLLVEFVAFQRSERTFVNVSALTKQIDADCLSARRLLGSDFQEPAIESVLDRRACAIASAAGH